MAPFRVLGGGEIPNSIVGYWPIEGVDEPDYTGECTVLCLDPCEIQFVPEPGTILFMGSGLTGLAAYAILRLRSGQGPRWRTKE